MWIFTFKLGSPLQDCYQPVIASCDIVAQHKMNKKYGPEWFFQYTLKEFKKLKELNFKNRRKLEVIK